MPLFIFKYCLPAMLGYTLFVGMAGSFNPFTRPHFLEERPSWLLSVWTGLTVSLVLGAGMHMAYGMSLDGARTLIRPTAMFMAVLLLPGFIIYFIWRERIRAELGSPTRLILDGPLDMSDEIEPANCIDAPNMSDEIESADCIDPPEHSEPETDAPLIAAFLHTAELQVMDSHDMPAANTKERFVDGKAGAASDSPHRPAEPAGHDAADAADAADAVSMLESSLRDEQQVHLETGKHLRITRKALATPEAESSDHESAKADAILRLEEKLVRSIDLQVTHEAAAAREKNRRIDLENAVVSLKRDLVKARQEIRTSTAARARALSTANKSIAFARQAVQIRADLETELEQAREVLQNRQATISSLIRELEREKNRTQEEISALVRRQVRQEKQTTAGRTLEGVARSVENRLSSSREESGQGSTRSSPTSSGPSN